MKPAFKLVLTCLFCSMLTTLKAQQGQYINYYSAIKTFDLSKIWYDNKLKIIDGDVASIDFPEPLGYIGSNYHRFYIHYTSIVKDESNPYRYNVEGKTRVNNNICFFKGTITIYKAKINPTLYYEKYKQGEADCLVELKEDSTQQGSGFIKGKLVSNWFIDKKGAIHYDSIDSEADGFCNNQCEGTWISYKTNQSKKCNWGDFRIPDSNGLDGGAGEFIVSEQYVKNGWQNYHDTNSSDKGTEKRAQAEEDRKWWE
jgi:hypothetical protein